MENLPLPHFLKERAEKDFTERINELIRTEIETKCDFLGIKKELYRKHNSFYAEFKDNFTENLDFTVNVTFSGQK